MTFLERAQRAWYKTAAERTNGTEEDA